MKKLIAVLTLAALLLTGCHHQPQKQSASYYDLFDTYCTLTVYDMDPEAFADLSEQLHSFLLCFHQETDIYQSYDGLTNLHDINCAAGAKPLEISDQLMAFLDFCQQAETISQHRVNVMIGAVTSLWHDGRQQGCVPEMAKLQAAALHTDPASLVLDSSAGTALITDPAASLDVGALAKGYAGRLAVEFLQQQGVDDFLLDLGGNLCAFGSPLGTGREQFTIGLQSPSGSDGDYAVTRQIQNECAVTSGDYQRYYEVDGVRYHHIIDPDTLLPADYHHSVTIIHEDSAMADLLSTAVFLLPEEEGTALAESHDATVIYLDE